MKPRICRIVEYRSRTGNYTVPALITCTVDTLASKGVEVYEETNGDQGVPPLSSEEHVHLAVFTPGIPGMRVSADDFVGERKDEPISENVAGTYQEWDVPYSSDLAPGTWKWPERTLD